MFKYISIIPFIFLLSLFSIKYEFLFDQTEISYFGNPIPWNSNNPALSLNKIIYILPLTLNILILAMLGFYLIRKISNFPKILELLAHILICSLGSISFVALLPVYVVNEVEVMLIPDSWPDNLISLSLSLGM